MAFTSQFSHHFIPAKKRGNFRSPKLMIVLHGRGDSLKPFKNFDEEMNIPGMNYLLINAPRKYLDGYTWYAFPPRQALGVKTNRKKISFMIEELKAQGWKTKDIYFFGFSQGSLVSCDFVMNYPERLGGIIGVSGYVYFFKNWKNKLKKSSFKTPILLSHGTRDEDLPMSDTKKHYLKLKNVGLKIDWLEVNKEHEIDEKRELPKIKKWLSQKTY